VMLLSNGGTVSRDKLAASDLIGEEATSDTAIAP
jgi:hypothetical protein